MSIFDYMVMGRNSTGYHFTDPNKPKHSLADYYTAIRNKEEKDKKRNRKRNKIARASRRANR